MIFVAVAGEVKRVEVRVILHYFCCDMTSLSGKSMPGFPKRGADCCDLAQGCFLIWDVGLVDEPISAGIHFDVGLPLVVLSS